MSAYRAAIWVWHMTFEGIPHLRMSRKLRWRTEKISAVVWPTLRASFETEGKQA